MIGKAKKSGPEKTRTAKIVARPPGDKKGAKPARSPRKAANKRRGPRMTAREAWAKARAFAGSKAARSISAALVCVALGGVVGIGAKSGWSWLVTTDRLAIREIVIRTGDKAPEREIRTLAEIREGDNIFSFHLSELVKAIEIHPWVEAVSVMRELPDKVVIDVVERERVAMVSLGSLYYVDKKGEIFKKVMPGEKMDFPVLTGLTLREAVDEREKVESLLKMGLEIVELTGSSEVFNADRVSEVRLSSEYGAVAVRVEDGMRVRFGREGYAEKLARLERALVELGPDSAKVAELDLNYEGRVTVRLKEGYRVASSAEDRPGEL